MRIGFLRLGNQGLFYEHRRTFICMGKVGIQSENPKWKKDLREEIGKKLGKVGRVFHE